jgi:single-strand DNA-binding protein
MYLNSIQIIGYVGKDPDRRQVRGNGAPYTVLSVATQRSWKNAQDEWQSKTDWHRVVLWNNRAAFAERLHAGDHVLVGGTLVSSTYERAIGKGKKFATLKLTSWTIRANVVRKLNRTDKESEVTNSTSDDGTPHDALAPREDTPF